LTFLGYWAVGYQAIFFILNVEWVIDDSGKPGGFVARLFKIMLSAEPLQKFVVQKRQRHGLS